MSPSFTLERFRALEKADQLLTEAYDPSCGIYYVVYTPAGWELFAHRYDDFPEELDHTNVWETDVAPTLARMWAKKLKWGIRALEKELVNYPYGFPRGRAVRLGEQANSMAFSIKHGGDVEPFMGVTRQRVERAFSIERRTIWELDLHEQCTVTDKEAVRELLRIKKDWKAERLG